MARRDDRGFDFTYSKLKKGRTAEIYFSAKAVKRKLAELKAVLPPEVYDFPAHTPADEMAVMLPLYQQLADANGRQQVSNGATSTLGLGLELGLGLYFSLLMLLPASVLHQPESPGARAPCASCRQPRWPAGGTR